MCLNAAAGLIVSGDNDNFKNAYQKTRNHILSGNAFDHLEKFKMGSNSLEEIINKKKILNLLKNKFKIEDLNYKLKNKKKYFLIFKEKINSNLSEENSLNCRN